MNLLDTERSTRRLEGLGHRLAAEVELAGVVGREVILRDLLKAEHENFDFVLMDCGPSLGVLTLNALAASGLPAGRLDLEITESVIITHPDKAVATLAKMKDKKFDLTTIDESILSTLLAKPSYGSSMPLADLAEEGAQGKGIAAEDDEDRRRETFRDLAMMQRLDWSENHKKPNLSLVIAFTFPRDIPFVPKKGVNFTCLV